MTSWWTAFAGAMVVLAALGNGSKLLVPAFHQERQVSAAKQTEPPVDLFDSQRKAVAYLEPGDDSTIYLWSGEPVAYLVDESIYSFNGRHLGWYTNGVVIDHDGNVVASPAIAFRKPVTPAPARGPKEAAPSKARRESQPHTPSLGSAWSEVAAHEFFLSHID
jgi:hypothetical protein